MIDLSKTIVLDTETTGTRKDDEVISLAIVDGFGERIFYDRIMPTRHTSWPEAEAINGIGWQDVQGKWTIGQLAPYLAALIEQADLVVGYNVTFDLRMLRQSGLDFKWVEAYDVMRELADEHNDGKWLKLEEAATVFGYRHERAHDALEDARATLYLFWLLSGGARPLHAGHVPSGRSRGGGAAEAAEGGSRRARLPRRHQGHPPHAAARSLLGHMVGGGCHIRECRPSVPHRRRLVRPCGRRDTRYEARRVS